MNVFGKALRDYYDGRERALWLNNNYGKAEIMPLDVFFRDEDELPELETVALEECRGSILDIGAGVGAHTLVLQNQGAEVTALEICPEACIIMQQRGVKRILNQDIKTYQSEQYDTLLMLMNGIGLCGDIAGLHDLLPSLGSLLKSGGQILFDSSDISYLYTWKNFPTERYYGEIRYQYEYESIKGKWFKWLYIDTEKMSAIAAEHGFRFNLIYDDGMDQYLARLSRAD